MKRVLSLTERQPCGACHQSIDDVEIHAVSGERHRFAACFGGDCNDISFENFAFDLKIFAGVGIV